MAKTKPHYLVTGGAGFIGRWLVHDLLKEGAKVCALDNYFNSGPENIQEFKTDPNFSFEEADVRNRSYLNGLFKNKFDYCYHLAASIIVQQSIDDPQTTFENDVVGTFHLLEACRRANTPMLFMSTCMVYDRAGMNKGIAEDHPVKSASPYAACKLAGEELTLSYFQTYGLPTKVVRPFNTYGPFQKSTGEGGVIAIFLTRAMEGKDLSIYGDGTQTRDFLYVKDCVDFIIKASREPALNGKRVNAGTGGDISVNDLAKMVCGGDAGRIRHVTHIHPQSEIPKLLCDAGMARKILGWSPRYTLAQGLKETGDWIKKRNS